MAFSPVLVNSLLDSVSSEFKQKTDDEELFFKIVNAPFKDKRTMATLGVGFLTLVLVNRRNKTIDRTAMTENDLAQGAKDMTVKPFEELIVPLNYKGNAVVEAIRSGRYQQTSDWNNLLAPVLKPEEARLNQAGAGIASSFIYPLVNARDGGAIIYQYFITLDRIGRQHHDFMFRYTKLVSAALRT